MYSLVELTYSVEGVGITSLIELNLVIFLWLCLFWAYSFSLVQQRWNVFTSGCALFLKCLDCPNWQENFFCLAKLKFLSWRNPLSCIDGHGSDLYLCYLNTLMCWFSSVGLISILINFLLLIYIEMNRKPYHSNLLHYKGTSVKSKLSFSYYQHKN